MDDRHNLIFDVERSMRYHERRRAFYESVDTSINALNLISGTAAVAALAALKFIGPVLPTVAGSLVAILSYINLTMRSTTMASIHTQLRQRYIELRLQLEDEEDGPVKEMQKARLMIEKDEPTMYRMLDLIVHNELCLSMGKRLDSETDCQHMYYVHPFKRLTAQWIRWETNSVVTIAQHRTRRALPKT